jgi:hypothetical protein
VRVSAERPVMTGIARRRWRCLNLGPPGWTPVLCWHGPGSGFLVWPGHRLRLALFGWLVLMDILMATGPGGGTQEGVARFLACGPAGLPGLAWVMMPAQEC